LKVFYSAPHAERLSYRDVKDLADMLSRRPHSWTRERLWAECDRLDPDKVRGSGRELA